MPVVSLAQMLESGVHFGHQARRWNPKMSEYIFTERSGVHIIDLVQTAKLMDEAYEYIRSASASGKRFLFVGTKRQAAGIVAQEATRCGSYFVNQRWLGGMLTNWTTIKTRVERLKDLERRQETGILDLLPKQEASMLRRELEKLQKYLGGIKLMNKVPDVVIIVDIRREYNAVQECQKLALPIASLLDTNCDPDWVDIPIPANDDAIRSIKLILGKLADAIIEGRQSQGSKQVSFDGDEDLDEDNLYDDVDEEDLGPLAADDAIDFPTAEDFEEASEVEDFEIPSAEEPAEAPEAEAASDIPVAAEAAEAPSEEEPAEVLVEEPEIAAVGTSEADPEPSESTEQSESVETAETAEED
jgi:small subunit ribosomal protein S2